MFGNKPGFKIGTFFDIPVYIHYTWWFIFVLFTMSQYEGYTNSGLAGGAAVFVSAITTIIIFATLLGHEYGHALAARMYGIGTERITLFMLGGVAQIREEPRRPMEEFVIAIAGPLVSLGFMVLFGLFAFGSYMLDFPSTFTWMFVQIAVINTIFAVFNMLPGFPMDGGRVLRSAVWAMTGNYLTATRIAFYGGVTMGLLLILLAILSLFFSGQGIFLGFTGGFLIYLSFQAYRGAQLKSAFSSIQVRHLMRPVQVVVPAELTIRQVVDSYINRIHADRFPVVQGGSLLGYISADDIAIMPREQWDMIPVSRMVKPYNSNEILNPDIDLMAAFQRMAQGRTQQSPVFRGRTLVGYLFFSDVIRHLRRTQKRA